MEPQRGERHRETTIKKSISTIGGKMGINKLITFATALAVLAASTGQLPKIILVVHLAQLHLIKESQASKWPKVRLLSNSNDQK